MSLTRLKYLMQEGTDDEIAQYLRQLGIGNGAPLIGVPFPFPVNKLPSDLYPAMKGMVFMKANGATFDKVAYPDCALAYPTGALPDLRGEFIRGLDDGRGVDSSRVALSSQSDDFKSHNHVLQNLWSSSDESSDASKGLGISRDIINVTKARTGEIEKIDPGSGIVTGYGRGGNRWSTTAISQTGGAETRPRNVAFAYMIRVK